VSLSKDALDIRQAARTAMVRQAHHEGMLPVDAI
jgi:hypothetical protein